MTYGSSILQQAKVKPDHKNRVLSWSAVYRALVRLNLIDPAARRHRDRKWKRWERGAAMELWQSSACRSRG